MLTAVFVIPLIFVEPFSTVISERIETFSNIEDDGSFSARTAGYNLLLNQALSEFVGKGIGFEVSTGGTGFSVNDGAILPLLFGLGWLGALPYASGIFLAIFKLLNNTEGRFDSFASAARAISLGVFAQIGFNGMFLGPIGIVFWSFLAMSMAASKYHSYQSTAKLKKD